jgi:hypothetical protein
VNLDPLAARCLGEDWCAAWNRRDIDAIMAYYTDDVRFCAPSVRTRWGIASGWLVGADRLRAHFERAFETPGLQFTFVDALVGLEVITLLYRRESGVLVADIMEVDAAGRGRIVRAAYGEAQASPGETSQH